MTKRNCELLAVLIDTEGCIYAPSVTRRSGKIGYQLMVHFSMGDPAWIEWAHQQFGGRVNYFRKGVHNRQFYRWVITTNKAIPILKAIMPYLKVKKRQAALGIRMQEAPVPQREKYAQRISQLNKGKGR